MAGGIRLDRGRGTIDCVAAAGARRASIAFCCRRAAAGYREPHAHRVRGQAEFTTRDGMFVRSILPMVF